ncbi:pyrimidine utilization protein D [Sphingomonas sp.]|uniref:pyrimidine utilization protein D n=1 Tax=Sphingomonas sp. TaxID=28214 RepID=UPI0035BC6CAB
MPEAAGLYYELHGPDNAPPLILSPGLGGSASYWTPNLSAFATDYRVILYDHRGTGRSDRVLPAVVTVDDLADDMLALLDALGIVRAHVIGHAAGGVAGLALALKAPERVDRLVTVNGWAKADPHFLRCFDMRLALLRHVGAEAYLRAQPIFLYPAEWITAHSDELDAELPHQLEGFPGAATMERRIAALAAFDVSDRLADVSRPLLTLTAQDDMLVPWTASDFAMDIAGARSARMDWGGHACNVTDPPAFNRLVLDYLRS